jgi:hypothetical protein
MPNVLSYRLAPAAVLAACLAWAPLAHAIEFQPGEWQETETGTEDGKPVKPEVNTSCMSAEEAKDPLKGLQPDKDTQGQCKTAEIKQTANGLTIRMQCGDAKTYAMDIDAQYTVISPSHYIGTIKSKVTVAGHTSTADKKVEARRIGACKE